MTKKSIRYFLGLGVALIALSYLTFVSFASAPSSGKLKNTIHAVSWSGSLNKTSAPSSEVPECSATPCDRFDLDVELPGGVWNNKPGGVQVALRWSIVNFGDNLRLYVYKGSSLVAKSDGIISSSQSVLIPQGENGPYKIYAAFDQDSSSPEIPYEALAEVEYAPNPQPARPLLPDLVARPQRNLTFQTPFLDFFEPPPAPGETCYPSEVAEEGAQTCLRFDQVFANTGEGPMEMRFVIPHDPDSTAHNIFQRLYRSDGGFDERLAGEWEFHEAHQHYHYTGFGLSRLFAANDEGQITSSTPVRTRRMKLRSPQPAQAIRSGRKVSFCLADTTIDSWLLKGDGPRTFNAPDCLFPAYSDADNDYLIQGITQGWADTYDWYLPDQYIEMTGVPDGYYVLETTVDPDNSLLEGDETNNCGTVLIRLSNMGTSSRMAEIIGNGPQCQQ